MNPKIIAFDADDTLWHNEPYFDEAEQERFCVLFHERLFVASRNLSQNCFESSSKKFSLIWLWD